MAAQELLKAFMREAAQQIYVVTARHEDKYAAFTAAAMSASLTPPSMIVTVEKRSRSHNPLVSSSAFVLHLLSQDQEWLARLMGDHVEPAEKLRRAGYVETEYGPVIAGVRNYLFLRISFTKDLGDNTLVLGEVVGGRVEGVERPLLYRRRSYLTTA
ncbi:MAG: flavin reductase family protein [Acidilobaceae archaeon]|nr:flavin reductase family protein [Acidilobaceae archaeon]MCX8166141.1 flavin reductase family protein [Acidilobaceae archaeon]MDW7974779.1 flavin reductase family protein [Sulfolobales archaeon]